MMSRAEVTLYEGKALTDAHNSGMRGIACGRRDRIGNKEVPGEDRDGRIGGFA